VRDKDTRERSTKADPQQGDLQPHAKHDRRYDHREKPAARVSLPEPAADPYRASRDRESQDGADRS
jgi:hypothetical protein